MVKAYADAREGLNMTFIQLLRLDVRRNDSKSNKRN